MTVKERFLSEDHAGEHATQTPHVQAVVIHLQITEGDEKAWTVQTNSLFFNIINPKHHFN